MLCFIIFVLPFVQVIRTADASGVILDETRQFAVNDENSNFPFLIGEQIGQPTIDEVDNNTLSNKDNFTIIGIDSPPQNNDTSLGGASNKVIGDPLRVIEYDIPVYIAPAGVIGYDDRSPSVMVYNISPEVNKSPQDSASTSPFSPPLAQGSVFMPLSQDIIVGPQDNDNFEQDQSYTNGNPSSQEIIPKEQFNFTEIKSQPFISNVMFESKLGAILPRQITPSKDDVNACRTFWGQRPQAYDGTQITHCYPLSAVGRLQIFFEGFSEPATCTGSVIGAHTALTAAHCFILETTNIEFTPGQFGDYKPFGSFQNGVVYTSGKFSWTDGSNDYAVVKFAENIGALTGWLGVEYGGCDNARGYDLMVAGFADDRSDQMWTAECADTFVNPCANGDQSGTFRHECDTNVGTSGAPLMENNFIVGVHSGYINALDKNTATYISRELMDFIDKHIS